MENLKNVKIESSYETNGYLYVITSVTGEVNGDRADGVLIRRTDRINSITRELYVFFDPSLDRTDTIIYTLNTRYNSNYKISFGVETEPEDYSRGEDIKNLIATTLDSGYFYNPDYRDGRYEVTYLIDAFIEAFDILTFRDSIDSPARLILNL